EYEIEQLRDLHSSLSKEYLQTLLDSQTSQVEERKRIVHLFHIKEQTILQKMNAIVEQIRDKSAQESDQLIDFYLKLTASSIVMLAVAAILMGLFIGNLVLRTHTYLQLKIERRTRDIQNANQLLAQSERRYRQIIESTSDIIITLNSNFVITSANTAVKKIFGINANDLIGNNFIDLIYEGSDGRGMSKKIILEKITDFLTEKNSVNFIADFCMPTILEPKTLHVQLEHIESEAQIEILGRGTPVANANLAKFLSYERLSLIADNYLSDANEISFRLTNMLIKYLEPSEITLIRIGLREMIINAIEHGNLEITFEEKTRALAENNYFELLAKRRNEAPFANRKVRIDSIINSAKAIFRITDDGKGFDVNAYLSKKEIEHTLSHGRGITMAMQVFDEVRYNNKGNQVLLIKYLDKNKPQQISGKGLSHCHPVLPV
ncbi:MAG: ATP-binding protein, partial [Spirochaetes bacterium]|nr:ATP-binding protein [Spirochaetota bacterium]